MDLGQRTDFLPLQKAGVIVTGNAAEVDWLAVCPPHTGAEMVVVGNPQFKGATWQTKSQKADMERVFKNTLRTWGELDYVAIWFMKATLYAEATGAPFAFVATNSITQGVQVAALWPRLLEKLEIRFAHRSFKWSNLAAHNAGVTCVIVGMGPKVKKTETVPDRRYDLIDDLMLLGSASRSTAAPPKRLFDGDTVRNVEVIGPYLAPDTTTIVAKASRPLAPDLEAMLFGNKPTDDGNLILDRNEHDTLIEAHPTAARFVRRLYGSQELMKGIERWCVWVRPDEVEAAYAIPALAERFERVREFRSKSTKVPTQKFAKRPWTFESQNEATSHTIMVPAITSEDRGWLPVAVMDHRNIINNKIYGLFDGSIWQAAVLSSRMHRLWLETVGGRLKEDPSYSNTLVWNTFPLPPLSERRKAELEEHWWQIDEARKEAGFGRSLGDLYAPDTMPRPLRRAHEDLDATVETILGSRRYRSDADRIEHMLQLYARMTLGQARPVETSERVDA